MHFSGLVRKGSRCHSGGAGTLSEEVIFIRTLYRAKALLKESGPDSR